MALVHEEKKPFLCNIFSACSAQRSVHEKKNPYQCKVCGASFEIVTRVSSWDYTVDHIWYLNDAVYRWSFLGWKKNHVSESGIHDVSSFESWLGWYFVTQCPRLDINKISNILFKSPLVHCGQLPVSTNAGRDGGFQQKDRNSGYFHHFHSKNLLKLFKKDYCFAF